MTASRFAFLVALTLLAGLPTTAAHADWMSYAMDDRGAVGHGRSPDRRTAENFALSYCGNVNCRVADTTTSRCMAFAESHYNGYFAGIGRAPTLGAAKGYALNWCTKGAPASTCRIRHSYCK